MELLFESRTNISDFTGQLNFVQHQPVVHPEPVVLPDTFTDRKGVSIYGSVHRDGVKLRMWYQAMPEDWDYATDMSSTAYAESDDGIHWTKPILGLVEHGPEPNNLVNVNLHCPSVFIDPDSAPTHRYRATGCGYPGLFMAHPDIVEHGYYTTHSADGLDWTLDATSPRWPSADVITSIYHPVQRRGIVAMKWSPRIGRMRRRSIHTAEFRNGSYSDAVSALYPDEFDDVAAAMRGRHSGDYYGMGMQGAGSGTVGFLWSYWHDMPYTGGGSHFALYGTSDVTLVYQPDAGGRWLHMPGRPTFIDHNEQPWMRGWINTSSCPVEMGDEHWLYFSGTDLSHGLYLDSNWARLPKWTEWTAQHSVSGIGFARWPKWRLFGFESDPEASFTIDLGVVDKPCELSLNYSTRPGGSVRVEVVGADKRSLNDCVALTGNSTGETVAWKTGAMIQPSAASVVVKLHLEVASVYAYELKPLQG